MGAHIVWAAAFPVALIYNLGAALAGKPHNGDQGHGQNGSGGGVGGSRSSGRTLLGLIGWFIAWPAWVITRLILVPLVASRQRGYEYQADAAAAEIGYATALSSALRKMGAFEGGRSGWEQAMSATHPPTQLRLEALQSPRPDDFEYQEEELRVPTTAETKRFLFGLRNVVRTPDGEAQRHSPAAPLRPLKVRKTSGVLGVLGQGLHPVNRIAPLTTTQPPKCCLLSPRRTW